MGVSIPGRIANAARELIGSTPTVEKQQEFARAVLEELSRRMRDPYDYFSHFTGVHENPDPTQKAGRLEVKDPNYKHPFGLYEQARDTDAHLAGVLEQRRSSVTCAPRRWEPADDSDQAQLNAAIVEKAFSRLWRFQNSLDALWDAVYYGLAVEEVCVEFAPLYVETELQDERGRPSGRKSSFRLDKALLPYWLKEIHQRRIIFDHDWNLRLLTLESPYEGIETPPNKFLHFAPYRRAEDPWGVGLARTCWWWSFFKRKDLRWWMVAIEKWASPTSVVRYPGPYDSDNQSKALSMGSSITQQSTLALPRGSGPEGSDGWLVELLEASRTSTNDMYKDNAEFCNAEISKAVLSQTLTTEQGDTGARAMAEVHLDVRDKLIRKDAQLLAERLSDLGRLILEWNVPEHQGLFPKLVIDTDPEEDAAANLQRFVVARNQLNLPLRRSQVYTDGNLEEPIDAEDTIQPPLQLDMLQFPEDGQDSPTDDAGQQAGRHVPASPDLPFGSARRTGRTGEAAAPRGLRLAFLDSPWDDRYLRELCRSAPAPSLAADTARQAAMLARVGRSMLGSGELARLYHEGVAAQAGILSGLPQLVSEAFSNAAQQALGSGWEAVPVDNDTSAVLGNWHQRIEFPAELRRGFIDRLNDDIDLAMIESRARMLRAAGRNASLAGRLASFGVPNPLFAGNRIIPEGVNQAFQAKLANAVDYDTFYRLDALGRAGAFTAWDLLEGDVRAIGSAFESAVDWGFTLEQFNSYLRHELQRRYVAQGEELHAWHIEAIYQTNFTTVWNQAQMDELHEMRDLFEFVQMVNPDPVHERCVEMAGQVYRTERAREIGHPPYHWNCDTYMIGLTADDLAADGLAVSEGPVKAAPENYQGPRDPSTGERVGQPAPFGAWAPLDERFESARSQIERIRSES